MAKIFLILLVSMAQTAFATDDAYDEALSSWQYVLQQYVDDQGRTDFEGLANDTTALRDYATYISKHGPKSTPALFNSEQQVLAYHINAYNALAMLGIIERNIPSNFNNFFKRASFFKFRSITVDGDNTSLHAYENDVIRPLGDARAHFALNCMVRDCPRLPTKPFQANSLDEQLDTAAQEFFNKRKHLYIDEASQSVFVSAILDFYTQDFVNSGKAQELISYINKYRDASVPQSYTVKFIDYDWTINRQP